MCILFGFAEKCREEDESFDFDTFICIRHRLSLKRLPRVD